MPTISQCPLRFGKYVLRLTLENGWFEAMQAGQSIKRDGQAIDSLRSYRYLLLVGLDLVLWIVGYLTMAVAIKVTHGATDLFAARAIIAGALAGLLFVGMGTIVKLHQGRAPVGSFDEAALITTTALLAGCIVLVVDSFMGWFAVTAAFGAPWIALILLLTSRGGYRVIREGLLSSTPRAGGGQERALIIGAGEEARLLVTALVRSVDSPWTPVALLDDDPLKRHRRVRGIAVVGPVDQLASVARELDIDTVILATQVESAAFVRQVAKLAAENGLNLKVLPGPYALHDPGRVTINDVRDIDLVDLLGRRQIDTDLALIAGYLANKRVLVTGAGGSIGSELCRQIAEFNPRELIMLDRDESALHAVELSIHGSGLLDGDNTVLGDIRDSQFLLELFAERRPEVVFHAAALKHLPLLEKAPGEAVKTNVWGSLNLLEVSAQFGVERFVNISTDKAANPTSVLGYSKRLAEGLTAAMAKEAAGTYLSVRFGNVLGSRGSVLTTFAAQIAAGGPVTVTDPNVTRYFMTIQEAVQLVVQAGAIGRPGEVLVLDMGEPVAIASVARQLIDIAGSDIEIVYTGLRDGEKLHEELFGEGEVDLRPEHDLISHAIVPPFPGSAALAIGAWGQANEITTSLHNACSDMKGRVLNA